MKLIYIIFFILQACFNNRPNNSNHELSNSNLLTHELNLVDDYTLPIKKDQAIITSLHYFEEFEKKYLSVLNNFAFPQIIIFDYDKRIPIDTININVEGEDGIGSYGTLNHFMINRDSILVTNFSGASKFVVINSDGVKLHEIRINTASNGIKLTHPFASNARQIRMIKDDIYLYLSPFSYKTGIEKASFRDFPTVMKIGKKKEYLFPLSEAYSNDFFGIVNFKYHSSFLQDDENTYIVSYPADPYVYKYHGNEVMNKSAIVSSYIDYVVPYHQGLRSFQIVANKIMNGEIEPIRGDSFKKYAFTNSDYGAIISDAFSGLFLRTVCLRPDSLQYELNNLKPQYSYVLFDPNLKKIGETLLPAKYKGEMFFTSDDGVFILDESANNISFGHFRIEKK